jgi:hypothetical protein
MWSHLLCVLIIKTKWPYKYHLCLEPILFFSFFFSKVQSLIIICVHTTIMIFISCGHLHPWVSPNSFTWIGPSYLVTHLDARISPNRFHQLAKTKLELSIWAFSFLFFSFHSIYRGEHATASENVLFAVTFQLRRLQKPPRLILFARHG